MLRCISEKASMECACLSFWEDSVCEEGKKGVKGG